MKKAMSTGLGQKNSTGLSIKMEGVVVHFDEPHGFGFIWSKDFSQDVFVHVRNIPDQQILAVGQKVMFDTKKTRKGLLAINVIPGKMTKSPHTVFGILGILGTGLMTFISYYQGLNIVWSYFLSINLLTFFFYGYDKKFSRASYFRIPESILHSLAICGAAPGGLVGQMFFRHKTMKKSFQIVYWVIVIVQMIILSLFPWN